MAVEARNAEAEQCNKAEDATKEAGRQRDSAIKAQDAERKAKEGEQAQRLRALQSAEEERKQRNEAVRQRDIAESRLYVSNMQLAISGFGRANTARGFEALNTIAEGTSSGRRDFSWYYLWKNNPKEEGRLERHADSINSVAFSPDGKTIASASDDKTVKLYLAATDEEVARYKNRMK